MRYTTCIDIREYTQIYRNVNARLVYLHLCLISGYHDDDRDICRVSLRSLAEDVGITFSALRCALEQLEKARIVQRKNGLIWVRKWVDQQPVTTRAKAEKERKQKATAVAAAEERRRAEQERNIDAMRQREQQQNGENGFTIYYKQQLAKAQSGDVDAQRWVKANSSTFEQAQKNLKRKNNSA